MRLAPFDDVFEFPNVAGPGMMQQSRGGSGAQPLGFLLTRRQVQKMLGQRHDVG
jgi:hypothetical protein